MVINEKSGFFRQKLDKTVSDVVKLLIKNGKKIATAESCTGGMLSAAITSVAGSSQVFDMGICTYANSAKTKLLGVPEDVLEKYGAVSPQTAQLMAEGILRLSGADYAVSTTGIAGPDGGTAEKPVGTVYVGIASKEKTQTKLIFTDTENLGAEVDKRGYVRSSTVLAAFEMLSEILV